VTGIAFDTSRLLEHLVLIGAAFLLALPIGWERQKAHRPAGLRTFPIVAIACCVFVLIGIEVFPDASDAQSRLIAGLMTGMGFIGGGAILKGPHGEDVRGVTTAASLWTMAALGAAVAYRRFELAIVLMVFNLLILRWLAPLLGERKNRSTDG
jgi:putative Mg2+ transporter-C (MgtC) family protein